MYILSHLAKIGWDENIWLFTKELNTWYHLMNKIELNYMHLKRSFWKVYRNYIFICRKKCWFFCLPCNCTCCIMNTIRFLKTNMHTIRESTLKHMPWIKVKVIEFEISQKCVVYTCRWVKLLNSYLRSRNILIVSEDVLILSHL